jgi:hypothetical protein
MLLCQLTIQCIAQWFYDKWPAKSERYLGSLDFLITKNTIRSTTKAPLADAAVDAESPGINQPLGVQRRSFVGRPESGSTQVRSARCCLERTETPGEFMMRRRCNSGLDASSKLNTCGRLALKARAGASTKAMSRTGAAAAAGNADRWQR